ncbi:MAG: BON domain-containing protein [Bacteroidetes bacterium]|nr:BON domain-containing protein [Bacteroidota bacterium]
MKTGTRADREIAERLLNLFEDDLEMADISGIRFFVRSGTVLVQGLVTSAADRQQLLSIVKQIPGLRSVENRLQTVQERLSASVKKESVKKASTE